ncbi:MAG: UDP-N-acetylmuramate--L-alanine ligase [Cyclobacteriaceae bacterium]
MNKTNIHFIAVGGSIMHNLALALQKKGLRITGSDDELYEPSKSRLEKAGIVTKIGWDANNITTDTEAVIVGMHAKKDNPELLKAQELNVPVYSFPEYIYEHSKNKQRIVIAGSHGKTSITAMVLHVLNHIKADFDYAVGAQLEGFDCMVKLSDAPYIIIEGDEYLSSPLDSKPKFLNYHHHIAVLNGISWDHMNVFPTEKEYIHQFELLAESTPKAGSLIYYEGDKVTKRIGAADRDDVLKFPYKAHSYKVKDGQCFLTEGKKKIPVSFFGEHNMINLQAAKTICLRLCVREEEFYEAIQSFTGASKRLEKIAENGTNRVAYRDFAHAPSKLKASCEAVDELYGKHKVIGCLELNTFSSLSKAFLPQYEKTFDAVDFPLIYINPAKLASRGDSELTESDLKTQMKNKKIQLFTDRKALEKQITSLKTANSILLLMSSGNFGGMDIPAVCTQFVN